MNRALNGADFILAATKEVPAVWGTGAEVLWSEGETLILSGPQGVGKSTVAQQLALARCGVLEPDLLRFPVAVSDKPVLYIAADRPKQVARSVRRMVTSDDHKALAERMTFWGGPLDFLIEDELELLWFAQKYGAGTVVIDSLKDLAAPLSEDRIGSAVNKALQHLLAENIEVLALHHHRKASGDNRKPNSIDDIYGSTWITSGAGSVISLWGSPGDAVIDLSHLKQPADVVGPLEIVHDHTTGRTTASDRLTVWEIVQQATDGGTTVREVTQRLYGPDPDRNLTEKARRKLEDLARRGHVHKVPGEDPKAPIIYRPVEKRVIARVADRVGHTGTTRKATEPGNSGTRGLHALSRTPQNPPSPLKGAADEDRVDDVQLATDEEEERIARLSGGAA